MPYKRGRKWMGQVRKNGKLTRKTFLTKKEAIAWETDQQKPECQDLPLKIVTVSLIEWAEKYLDYSKVKFSAKTYEEKKAVFRSFFRFVDHSLPAAELKKGHVLSFLQEQAKNRSGYAANKDRKNLVAAWNWGIKYLDLPALNPCLVDRFPEIRQVRYVPPEKDFWKVYDQASSEQDKLMLLVFLHLAARRSEVFRLCWEDVDFSESKVRLYTRKTKDGSLEYDWLPLTDDLYEALLAHKQSSSTQWVFPDPETGLPYLYRQHMTKKLCERAGVKHFGFHAIRHLTASILAKANVPMIDIQTILRHKNLSTTERYIRRLETVRPALSVLPGTKAHKKGTRAHSSKKEHLKLIEVTN